MNGSPQKLNNASQLRTIRAALPGIVPATLFGPNKKTRSEARALLRDVRREVAPLSLVERIQCLGSPLLATWTSIANRLRIFQQPGLLRVEHRPGGNVPKEASVFRLQGGFHANPIKVLSEDVTRNARDLWRCVFAPSCFGRGFLGRSDYTFRGFNDTPEMTTVC